MTDDKTEKTKAGWLSRIWRVVVAAAVFLAICAAIDLIRHRPINILTGERVGGMVAVAIAVSIDSLRKRKTNR